MSGTTVGVGEAVGVPVAVAVASGVAVGGGLAVTVGSTRVREVTGVVTAVGAAVLSLVAIGGWPHEMSHLWEEIPPRQVENWWNLTPAGAGAPGLAN